MASLKKLFKPLIYIKRYVKALLFLQKVKDSQQLKQYLMTRFNINATVNCFCINYIDRIELSVTYDKDLIFEVCSYGDKLVLYIPIGTLTTMAHPQIPGGYAASEVCATINQTSRLGTATISSRFYDSELVFMCVPLEWKDLRYTIIQDLLEQVTIEFKTVIAEALHNKYISHQEEVDLLEQETENEDDDVETDF